MARKKQKREVQAKIGPEHPFFGIIEDAYRVFDYEKPSRTGVCEYCCMSKEIEDDFFGPTIRDLPLHYLRDWFFAACDPSGVPKRIWGYLLPRVLEVLAVGQEPATVGFEVSLNRFQTGNRENWSEAEWDVLDRFQRAYLSREMTRETEYLDDTLCMFGLAGWPLPDLCGQVAASPDDCLAKRFWNDWCRGRPSIWITAFWDGGRNSEIFDFYTSNALFDRMESLALDPETEPGLADKALAVASVIEANATWAQRDTGQTSG